MIDNNFKNVAAAATAKSFQSCQTLCNPRDGSPPGSPISGILQARTLEWVAISFSNAWKWKVKVKSLSSVRLFMTPWTAAHQAPSSIGFSRQEYWTGVPSPSPLLMLTVPKVKIPLESVGKLNLISYMEDHMIVQNHLNCEMPFSEALKLGLLYIEQLLTSTNQFRLKLHIWFLFSQSCVDDWSHVLTSD